MKKIIILIILFVHTFFYSQTSQPEKSNGYVLEYNSLKDFKYQVFKPIKIKLIDSQNEIDYSKIEGVLQSYFSATNLNWAKSDYLDSIVNITRDDEHFQKIKTLDKNTNYIELESAYNFTYNNQDMAFVKFSFTFSGMPFQLLNSLSLAKKDGRWYIKNLSNQVKINMCLTNFKNEFLIDVLKPKSTNILATKSSRYKYIDFDLLFDNFETLDKDAKRKIQDERIWNQQAGLNYNKNTIDQSVTNKTVQTFTFKSSLFYQYGKNDKLFNDDKIKDKYKNELVKSLIPTTTDTIKLIHKITFELNNSKIEIVKYQLNNKFYSKLFGDSKPFDIANTENLLEFIRIIKSKTFDDILRKKTGNDFQSIMNKSVGNTNGINISNLSDLMIQNKISLSKYLDK